MMPFRRRFGADPADDLSLRVSVAALVGVLFNSPEDGRTVLALERTATLRETGVRSEVAVRAKPFGGAVRLIEPHALQRLVGAFRYDSDRSRRERDFRILVHPSSWEKIKKICRRQVKGTGVRILDPGPERELTEEFQDSLNVTISPDQYSLKQRGMLVREVPEKTENVRARGRATVRVYFVFEARIEDPKIVGMILDNSRRYSDDDLEGMARDDARQGGRGRANAVLALSLDDLVNAYRLIPAARRNAPVRFAGHQLDGNVAAVLPSHGLHD
jgi:hypothetical protein